jgi:hypothetical protein
MHRKRIIFLRIHFQMKKKSIHPHFHFHRHRPLLDFL